MRSTPVGPLAVTLASMLAVAGCGGSAEGSDADGDSRVSVVASTDVYGDIVSSIAGDAVEVTSLIDDPSADPHSFEVSTRTQLTVSRADLVVLNGGGYDDFMQTLISSADTGATVIDAVEVSGQEQAADAAGVELNEHVWYDFPSMLRVADAVVTALADIDPDSAATYQANGTAFTAQVQGLVDQASTARQSTLGAGVAITEPVPGYLLDALGAENRTPEPFSEAIEEGGDVSPAVLRETLDLFGDGQVRALVYNEQTTGAETEAVLDAARSAGTAVVPVAETLPDGEDYVSWMRANLDAVVGALTS